jgi:uncharacterized protein with FMN-binding domain
MKKILLSAAVIALSGAYVAYEDHGAAPSLAAGMAAVPSAAYVAPAVVKPEAPTPTFDQAPSPVAPPRAPTSAALPAPAALKPATKVASAAPRPAAEIASAAPPASVPESAESIGSIIADAAPTPSADDSEAAPAVPQSAAVVPLPLPRPADAPQSSAAAAAPSDSLSIQRVAAAQDTAQVQGAYRSGTYKGVSANAYYGRVQVEAIVSNGRLASIRMLDYPRDRRRSLYIAQQSLPVLEQEAIAAQSGNIDTVSGATLTSRAFIKSLDSALSRAQAGGGNA